MLIDLYHKMPTQIKSLAVTLYGLKVYRERNNKEGRKHLTFLINNAQYVNDMMRKLQDRLFVEIVRHAINNVPYYQSWAKLNSYNANDFRDLKDIVNLPIISKELIKESPDSFVARNIKNKFSMFTSGSTGNPLKVVSDPISRSKHYAFFNRIRLEITGKVNPRRATMFGRPIISVERKTPPFWVYDYINKNLLLSSYHINENSLSLYTEKLIQYSPEEIFSYPSSILPVANFIIENNIKIHVPLVMVTAENVTNNQILTLKKAFNGVVINQYGCTEMTHFCTSTNDSTYHVAEPYHGFLEVVNKNHCTHEGSGELVATGFVNMAMPLLRYKLNDIIELKTCKETQKQLVLNIDGRKDDYIILKDGTKIGRLDPIFKGSVGYTSAQIIQETTYDISINVVPTSEWSEATEQKILSEAKARIGGTLNIKVNRVQSIMKSKNGKIKTVISNLVN